MKEKDMQRAIAKKEALQLARYQTNISPLYSSKSGENGKVGNPDTGHPTPSKASGVEGLIPGAVAGSTRLPLVPTPDGALSAAAARGKGKKKPVPFN